MDWRIMTSLNYVKIQGEIWLKNYYYVLTLTEL